MKHTLFTINNTNTINSSRISIMKYKILFNKIKIIIKYKRKEKFF